MDNTNQKPLIERESHEITEAFIEIAELFDADPLTYNDYSTEDLEFIPCDVALSNLLQDTYIFRRGHCFETADALMMSAEDALIYVEGWAIPTSKWRGNSKLSSPIIHGFTIDKRRARVIDPLYDYLNSPGWDTNGKIEGTGVIYIPVIKTDYRSMRLRKQPISVKSYTRSGDITPGNALNKKSHPHWMPKFLQAYDQLLADGYTRTGWDHLDFCRSSNKFMRALREHEDKSYRS